MKKKYNDIYFGGNIYSRKKVSQISYKKGENIMRGTTNISQIRSYCITGNQDKDKGRGTPRGLIRKRLDWFDSKANNATSCVGKSRGTVKAAAWLNLNSPPPPTLSTTKLICKGRVDRANRNSAVQISYPRFPRAAIAK